MKQLIIKQKPAFVIGCLLTLPTLLFFFISIMKFELGSPYLFDAATPFLESTGISEPPGFNINLLILFGPVLAFLLNLFAVLHLQFDSGKERISPGLPPTPSGTSREQVKRER